MIFRKGKSKKAHQPMMVKDLMNDLERETKINERIKMQLDQNIDASQRFTGLNDVVSSTTSFASTFFISSLRPW